MEPKSGKIFCPVCLAEFEIDDRLGSILYVNVFKLKNISLYVKICQEKGSENLFKRDIHQHNYPKY
jgi:hypothetical protein